MDKRHAWFKQTRIATGGEEPIDIPLPPWALWGQPNSIYQMADDIDEDRESTYHITAKFSKANTPILNLSYPITDDIAATGDSYFDLRPPGDQVIFTDGSRTVAFTLIRNSDGKLAALKSDAVAGITFSQAVSIANNIANTIIVSLTVATNIPAFINELHIHSEDNREFYARSVMPYPEVYLEGLVPNPVPSMLPFLALFAEGMHASSPSYRLLCFFKVVDKLLDTVNQKLRKLAEHHKIKPLAMNDTVPADPFAHIAPKYSGSKYTVVRDELRETHRNAIAHLNLDSAIQPYNYEAEREVIQAALTLAHIARELLHKTYEHMNELAKAGCKVAAISFSE